MLLSRNPELRPHPSPSPRTTASPLPILPPDWERMDFGGWREVEENREGRRGYRSTCVFGRGRWQRRPGPSRGRGAG